MITPKIFLKFWLCLIRSHFYSLISSEKDNSFIVCIETCQWLVFLRNLFCGLLFVAFTHSGLFLCMFCNWFWIDIHLTESEAMPAVSVEDGFCPEKICFCREPEALPLGSFYLRCLFSFPSPCLLGLLLLCPHPHLVEWISLREAENMGKKKLAGLRSNLPQRVQWSLVGFPRRCWIWCFCLGEGSMMSESLFSWESHTFRMRPKDGRGCHMYDKTFFTYDDMNRMTHKLPFLQHFS